MDYHQTTCYLQLTADTWERYDGARVRSIKVAGLTQQRPRRPAPGAVVVALNLQLPDAAFLPLSPSATVVVPLALVDTEPITVEAVAT
jgi:hypothetical protein